MKRVEAGKHKEKYLEPKKKDKRASYQAKRKAERSSFGNAMWKDDQKYDVFITAKRLVQTNQDIIGEYKK